VLFPLALLVFEGRVRHWNPFGICTKAALLKKAFLAKLCCCCQDSEKNSAQSSFGKTESDDEDDDDVSLLTDVRNKTTPIVHLSKSICLEFG